MIGTFVLVLVFTMLKEAYEVSNKNFSSSEKMDPSLNFIFAKGRSQLN